MLALFCLACGFLDTNGDSRGQPRRNHPDDVAMALRFRVPHLVAGCSAELDVTASGIVQGVTYTLAIVVASLGDVVYADETSITMPCETGAQGASHSFQHVLPPLYAGPHTLRVTIIDTFASSPEEAELANVVRTVQPLADDAAGAACASHTHPCVRAEGPVGGCLTDDDSAEDEESAYTFVNISKHAEGDSAQCVVSAAVVCHNPERRYQEIYNSAANFVAYLQISGSTRQLHRFLPTHHHPTPDAPDSVPGIYRAYYHDYGPGLVYKSKILVLLNTSDRGHCTEFDTCWREQRPSQLYSRYKFMWISTGRQVSEGGYFQAAHAAGRTDSQIQARPALANSLSNSHTILSMPREPAAAIDGPFRFHEPATIMHRDKPTVSRDMSKELRTICSFGDSQMRNNIMQLLQSRFPECTGTKDSPKACPSTKSGYYWIGYAAHFLAPAMREVCTSHEARGEPMKEICSPGCDDACVWCVPYQVWGNKTRCPLVIVNFGQWDLGYPNGFMTPFRDYVKDVHRVLQSYLAVREPNSLIWATINPHPLPRRCAKEWRFLDLIERFNEGATAAAKASNVSVWDTYSVLKHVFDLTYDGISGHYRFPDAVGASLLSLLTERDSALGRRSAPS